MSEVKEVVVGTVAEIVELAMDSVRIAGKLALSVRTFIEDQCEGLDIEPVDLTTEEFKKDKNSIRTKIYRGFGEKTPESGTVGRKGYDAAAQAFKRYLESLEVKPEVETTELAEPAEPTGSPEKEPMDAWLALLAQVKNACDCYAQAEKVNASTVWDSINKMPYTSL